MVSVDGVAVLICWENLRESVGQSEMWLIIPGVWSACVTFCHLLELSFYLVEYSVAFLEYLSCLLTCPVVFQNFLIFSVTSPECSVAYLFEYNLTSLVKPFA